MILLRFPLPCSYCFMPYGYCFLMSLELITHSTYFASDQNQSDTDGADNQGQGAHRTEITIDIEVIQQGAQGFGARRIEKIEVLNSRR